LVLEDYEETCNRDWRHDKVVFLSEEWSSEGVVIGIGILGFQVVGRGKIDANGNVGTMRVILCGSHFARDRVKLRMRR